MGKVVAEASMSLDGFIAKDDNTIGRLFDWLQNGEIECPSPAGDITFHLTPTSAEHWRGWLAQFGALVVGRTLFDVAEGWRGRHSIDIPVVVVTHSVSAEWVESHPDAPFHFVTEGVQAAVELARQVAGDRAVFVSAGTIARQCLELGLLDEVVIELVPVVMGSGRPYFGDLSLDDVPLGDPTTCIQSKQVMHLVFPVARS
jgi:dihydrofolate reductase